MAYNATNEATQARLRAMMEEANTTGFKFSPTGMHYLACRVNGVRYRKAILAAFELLLKGELKTTTPAEMLERATVVLNRKELPEEALIIFATGRRPILSKLGAWQEEGVSLLTAMELTETQMGTLPKDKQEKLNKAIRLRELQRDACLDLLNFYTEEYDQKHPVVATTDKVKPKKTKEVKSADIIPISKLGLGKKPKPVEMDESAYVNTELDVGIDNEELMALLNIPPVQSTVDWEAMYSTDVEEVKATTKPLGKKGKGKKVT